MHDADVDWTKESLKPMHPEWMIDEAFGRLLKQQIQRLVEQEDRSKLNVFQLRQKLVEQYGEGIAWNQRIADRLISMTLVTSQRGSELQNPHSSIHQSINVILSGDSRDV